MPRRVSPAEVVALQGEVQRMRNICILAHVDHGKTSLADSLISSNGIISAKLAGTLRYLDSTPEEQLKGITMHSSAISLMHTQKPQPQQHQQQSHPQPPASSQAGGPAEMRFLINLIDSPGHIDFSSDVSTATRLCDGALIVVDVLEGVCVQTQAVIRQAWRERMTPCLVLNKVDRLFADLQLTPEEAFSHLRRVLENVNAVTNSLILSEVMRRDGEAREGGSGAGEAKSTEVPNDDSSSVPTKSHRPGDGGSGVGSATESEMVEETESVTDTDTVEEMSVASTADVEAWMEEQETAWDFAPEKGNVIFASALDCWGFGVQRIANIWAKRLQVRRDALVRTIWGDYALNPKTKKVVRITPSSKAKPMFVTMILEPLWQLYTTGLMEKNTAKLVRMAGKLDVQLSERETVAEADPKNVLNVILRQWLPLADTVLRMVVRCVPSPPIAQRHRIQTLWNDEAVAFGEDSVNAGTATASNGDGDGSAADAARVNPAEMLRVEEAVAHCEVTPPMSPGTVAGMNAETAGNGLVDRAGVVAGAAAATGEGRDGGASETPVVVFVSKMMPVKLRELASDDPLRHLRKEQRRAQQLAVAAAAASATSETTGAAAIPEDDVYVDDEDTFVAFARVFSGVLDPVNAHFLLGPKYHPLHPSRSQHYTPLPGRALRLYVMMGSSLLPVDRVQAGNLVAISGLEACTATSIKTATISSTRACPALRSIVFQSQPMVRVAVGPVAQRDMDKLEAGLVKLYQADPAIEISVEETGEHVIAALGEFHMEQSIKDLQERYAGVPVRVSPPLVSFRESVVMPANAGERPPQQRFIPPWCQEDGLRFAHRGRVRLVTPGGQFALVVQCFALSEEVIEKLDGSGPEVQTAVQYLDALSNPSRAMEAVVTDDAAAAASATDGTATSKATRRKEWMEADWAKALPSELRSIFASIDRSRVAKGDPTSEGNGGGPAESGATATAASDELNEVSEDEAVWQQVLAFGPRRCGTNLLVIPRSSRTQALGCRFLSWDAPELPASKSWPVGRADESWDGSAAWMARKRREELQQQQQQQQATAGSGFEEGDGQREADGSSVDDFGGGGGTGGGSGAGFGDDAPHESKPGHDWPVDIPDLSSRDVVADLLAGNVNSTSTPLPAVSLVPDNACAEVWNRVLPSINTGFQVATAAGPIADEPMHGTVFLVMQVELTAACLATMTEAGSEASTPATGASEMGMSGVADTAGVSSVVWARLAGQIITLSKAAYRSSFLSLPVRLREPMYRCDLQCHHLQLGKLYALLAQRRGIVIEDDVLEGSELFVVAAYLPVVESFGFANALLKQTSGAATSPQLRFSHWTIISAARGRDEDDTEHFSSPFWRPTTEDEREDLGEEVVQESNMARQCVDRIRERKGLPLEAKVVAHAEKQRTLTRNK